MTRDERVQAIGEVRMAVDLPAVRRLVATVVWYGHTKPMWSIGGEMGEPQCFSADGSVLVTTVSSPVAKVRRWDVQTGRLLSEVTFPQAIDFNANLFSSPDGGRVLVLHAKRALPTSKAHDWHWHLHDGWTGRDISGPISDLRFAASFSADSRWFVGTWHTGFTTRGIGSADNGQPVMRLRPRNKLGPYDLIIAPDGISAAALWGPAANQDAKSQCYVQIFELPSGRETCWHPLPYLGWQRLRFWDGKALKMVGTGANVTEFRSFLVGQDHISAGGRPVPVNFVAHSPQFYREGQDWRLVGFQDESLVARCRSYSPLFADLLKKAGFDDDGYGHRSTIFFLDPTNGRVRYTLPRPICSPFVLSLSGKRLACPVETQVSAPVTMCHGIEMWDTDPRSRWPWVTAAGIAGFVLPMGIRLGLGRLRGMRAKRPERANQDGAVQVTRVAAHPAVSDAS